MKRKNNSKKPIQLLLQSMLVPAIIMVVFAVGMQACDHHTMETGGPAYCVPNASQACICSGGDFGVQTCLPDGTFERCACLSSSSGSAGAGGSSGTGGSGGSGGINCHEMASGGPNCGDGSVQSDEECDDGNCDPTDQCNNNCRIPFCGDHVVQPPEICDGDPGCLGCGFTGCGTSYKFAGFAAPQAGAFVYQGQLGIDASIAACQALGAFGMCNYAHWKNLELNPQLYPTDIGQLTAQIQSGTCMTVWLERETNLPNCPAGPGANCNNWNYSGDTLADGEYLTICNNNGTLAFSYELDCDPTYDPIDPLPHNAPGLECSAIRAIPCCYESCSP